MIEKIENSGRNWLLGSVFLVAVAIFIIFPSKWFFVGLLVFMAFNAFSVGYRKLKEAKKLRDEQKAKQN